MSQFSNPYTRIAALREIQRNLNSEATELVAIKTEAEIKIRLCNLKNDIVSKEISFLTQVVDGLDKGERLILRNDKDNTTSGNL